MNPRALSRLRAILLSHRKKIGIGAGIAAVGAFAHPRSRAVIGAHSQNAYAGGIGLLKSNREKSESEYRASQRVKRGAKVGAVAGAGFGLYKAGMHRGDFRHAVNAAKYAFATGGDVKYFKNVRFAHLAKRASVAAAIGAGVGGAIRLIGNRERVVPIKKRTLTYSQPKLQAVRRVK